MLERLNISRAKAKVIILSARVVKSDRHERYTRTHYYCYYYVGLSLHMLLHENNSCSWKIDHLPCLFSPPPPPPLAALCHWDLCDGGQHASQNCPLWFHPQIWRHQPPSPSPRGIHPDGGQGGASWAGYYWHGHHPVQGGCSWDVWSALHDEGEH